MPIIKLTETPNPITPEFAMVNLWGAEILAHSFYPEPDAGDTRRKWVEKIQRQFAKDWTSRFIVLQHAGDLHRHWFALHGLTQEKDEIGDFKHNEDRDLKFAARILIHCTLDGMSKIKSITRVASELMAQGGANSLHSAKTTVKRAWRKYANGCHYMAAWAMVPKVGSEQSRTGRDFAIFTTVSLAEELRAMGETTIPSHGSVPILDVAKTWTVSEWFPRSTITIRDWKEGSGLIQSEMPVMKVSGLDC